MPSPNDYSVAIRSSIYSDSCIARPHSRRARLELIQLKWGLQDTQSHPKTFFFLGDDIFFSPLLLKSYVIKKKGMAIK